MSAMIAVIKRRIVKAISQDMPDIQAVTAISAGIRTRVLIAGNMKSASGGIVLVTNAAHACCCISAAFETDIGRAK